MCHITPSPHILDGGRRRRRSHFSVPAAVSPPSPSLCRVLLILFLWVCWAVLHRGRQITSGAAAMGPNMAPANTTESHTHTQKHTLVPACPKMLFCGGTKGGVCCSYLTHSYIREFSNTKCTVVSVMQGTAFTWLAKAGKESLYFQNPSHWSALKSSLN